jgi:hypothetical protein
MGSNIQLIMFVSQKVCVCWVGGGGGSIRISSKIAKQHKLETYNLK